MKLNVLYACMCNCLIASLKLIWLVVVLFTSAIFILYFKMDAVEYRNVIKFYLLLNKSNNDILHDLQCAYKENCPLRSTGMLPIYGLPVVSTRNSLSVIY